mgnify:CR=1 FL=1
MNQALLLTSFVVLLKLDVAAGNIEEFLDEGCLGALAIGNGDRGELVGEVHILKLVGPLRPKRVQGDERLSNFVVPAAI